MKLNIVLLVASILQTHAQGTGMNLECYTKVDCKVLDFMKEAIKSGKGSECEGKGVIADVTKCQLEAFGLSKDQAELSWKVFPYTSQCVPKVESEFKTCTVGCSKQKDRDSCLESCALPPKVESEECLDKLAGKSTSNASKNAKCMMDCDKNTYSEIFDCQYNCHKDVLDTLAGKDSGKEDDDKDSDKSTGGASKSSSSGSQAKPTGSSQPQSGSSGQSSAYLTAQVSSLAKASLSILIISFLL